MCSAVAELRRPSTRHRTGNHCFTSVFTLSEHAALTRRQTKTRSVGVRSTARPDTFPVTRSREPEHGRPISRRGGAQDDGRFDKWLRLSGRLFLVVGEPPLMEAWAIRRVGMDEWQRESLFETSIPALIDAPNREKFEF